MIRWYAGSDVDAPEAVECDQPGYPHHDAKGRGQYDNSHFNTEAEAWMHLLADASAHVRLVGHDVAWMRSRLREVEQQAGDAAERFARVARGHETWERERA
jgi:hypothetical protein